MARNPIYSSGGKVNRGSQNALEQTGIAGSGMNAMPLPYDPMRSYELGDMVGNTNPRLSNDPQRSITDKLLQYAQAGNPQYDMQYPQEVPPMQGSGPSGPSNELQQLQAMAQQHGIEIDQNGEWVHKLGAAEPSDGILEALERSTGITPDVNQGAQMQIPGQKKKSFVDGITGLLMGGGR